MSGSKGAAAPRGGKLGVPAAKLSDRDFERESRRLWRTREETILHGGSHAIRAHTDRMLELEHEYVARFPRETQPSPSRTRRGSRMNSLQPAGRGTGRRAAPRARRPSKGAKR
ncbi:MAG: DUF6158 family protein [Actinomycetota bacterium]